ncbi:MAG: GNAT family N-acetyltransferase [Desulfobacterales bacterium]|nr:GNAT family N-acetyltransferase [Desulfobacterales bacterium]
MTYIFKHPETTKDRENICTLLNQVFKPEKVGDLAHTFMHHLPGMDDSNWFTMCDPETCDPVAVFALIPWTWEMDGIQLKVAEMGLVGTRQDHRGKGLMKKLNQEFFSRLKEDKYDLSIIQGIPGFYHNLGYHYAIEFESHIDLPLALIPEANTFESFSFRRAGLEDIDFLMNQDKHYRQANTFCVSRDSKAWEYLLTHSRDTEYGADFWIMETESTPVFYARVPFQGFGHGLILSEVSHDISHDGFVSLVQFLKTQAIEKGKPHIRVNLHPQSPAAQMAISLGATQTRPYAWQVKIPDQTAFLQRITPILEKRLAQSMFKGFSGQLQLNLYTESIDLEFNHGKISIASGQEDETKKVFCIPKDLFPALVLGYRNWNDLQACRPDIFPANQYLRFKPAVEPDEAGLLIDVLFPSSRSWIYERF